MSNLQKSVPSNFDDTMRIMRSVKRLQKNLMSLEDRRRVNRSLPTEVKLDINIIE